MEDIIIEIVDALGQARQNYELGKSLGGLLLGQGLDDIEKGLEHLKSINSNENREYHAREALAHFNKIDDNDKKYIRAMKLYGKAQCYYFMFLFDEAISELNKLNAIEVTYGTYNSKTVNDCKSEGVKLRQGIYELRKQLAEYRTKRTKRKRNIIITAVIIAIIILCIVIYKFILNN